MNQKQQNIFTQSFLIQNTHGVTYNWTNCCLRERGSLGKELQLSGCGSDQRLWQSSSRWTSVSWRALVCRTKGSDGPWSVSHRVEFIQPRSPLTLHSAAQQTLTSPRLVSGLCCLRQVAGHQEECERMYTNILHQSLCFSFTCCKKGKQGRPPKGSLFFFFFKPLFNQVKHSEIKISFSRVTWTRQAAA